MKFVVFGSDGRVGSRVCELAKKRGHTVVPVEKNTPESSFGSGIDAVIDFSVPEATKRVCELCLEQGCPLITGVTGRNEQQQALIDALAKRLPVTAKANFSQGVEMLYKLVALAATLDEWDCEIVEIHRKNKLDSPSGTAKKLAATAARAKSFKKVTVHSLRCGSCFGTHTIVFATQGESLTLTHQAENCDIFARGALAEAEKSVLSFAKNVADGKGVRTVDGD